MSTDEILGIKPVVNLTKSELIDLEMIVDSRGLPKLLDAIADICRAKSEHIATNWQDKALADLWDARADVVANTVPTIQNT